MLPAGLLVLSLLYCAAGFNFGLLTYDEGLNVYGALRVTQGDVPYRDFWSLYPPGGFYILAGLYKIFGTSLIVGRFWHMIVSSLLAVTVFTLARRVSSDRTALITWLFALVWIDSFRFPSSPLPVALLFAMLSVILVLRYLNKRRAAVLVPAGVAVALATLFRHDLGFYTFVAEMAVLTPFAWRNARGNPLADRRGGGAVLPAVGRTWLAYLLGMGIVFLPTVLPLVVAVPARELFDDLVVFPLTVFPKVRSLPYPAPLPNPQAVIGGEMTIIGYVKSALSRWPFYYPMLVYGLGVVWIAVQLRRKKLQWDTEEIWRWVLLIILGVLYINQARFRSHISHLIPTFLPALILCAMLLHSILRTAAARGRRTAAVVLIGVTLLTVARPLHVKYSVIKAGIPVIAEDTFAFRLVRAEGIRWNESGKMLQDAVEYVQANVPEDGTIFVGCMRHDRIFTNDIIFYFLSDRRSATKYHELHPGLATTEEVQQKIVSELQEHDVQMVVLKAGDVVEPNESAKSSGVRLLDEFIRTRFRQVQQFGDYSVWKRE
jgi:hypothetical protein